MLIASFFPTLTADTNTVVDFGINSKGTWPAAIEVGFVSGAANTAFMYQFFVNGVAQTPFDGTALPLTSCPQAGAFFLSSANILPYGVGIPGMANAGVDIKLNLYSSGTPQLFIHLFN